MLQRKSSRYLFGTIIVLATGCSLNSAPSRDEFRVRRSAAPTQSEIAKSGAESTPSPGHDGSMGEIETRTPESLRRLTKAQVELSLTSLFGSNSELYIKEIAEDVVEKGISKAGPPNSNSSNRIFHAAGDASQKIVSSPSGLPTCTPVANGADNCLRMFVEKFGFALFRRPLTVAEGQKYLDTVSSLDGDDSKKNAIVSAMIQSPKFHYLLDSAPRESTALELRTAEWLTRVSLFLRNRIPTTSEMESIQKLKGQKKESAEYMRAFIEGQLASPEVRSNLGEVFLDWLDIRKIAASTRPGNTLFTPMTAAAMGEEAKVFFLDAFFSPSSSYAFLYAPVGFVNKHNAWIYGQTSEKNEGMDRVSLDGTDRGGIVSLPAFVTRHSSGSGEIDPIHIGKAIRERLLCSDLPSPPVLPADSLAKVANASGGTLKQRLRAHRESPSCAGCHSLMDEMAFGLMNLDDVGKLKSEDPPDLAGNAFNIDEGAPEFKGAKQLGFRLANSTAAQKCFVQQMFRRYEGRRETGKDSLYLDGLNTVFQASGHHMRNLVLELLMTDGLAGQGVQK